MFLRGDTQHIGEFGQSRNIGQLMIDHDEEHVDLEMIRSYVEHRLEPNRVRDLTDHFAICASCRSVLAKCMQEKLRRHSGTCEGIELPTKDVGASFHLRPQSDLHGYRIVRPISQGGMGRVYEAVQLVTGRTVALKFIVFSGGETFRTVQPIENVLREVRAMAALSHPNIIQVIDVIVYRESPVIVMEYFNGETLSQWRGQRLLDQGLIARLLTTISEGVAHAHERGVVHCDLKPQNILVFGGANDLELKIIDFGIAKIQRELKETSASVLAGTLAYMAPEQMVHGAVALDLPIRVGAGGDALEWLKLDSKMKGIEGPGIDIHAMGVILYELLTSRRPFESDDRDQLIHLIRDEIPVGPRQIDRTIPRDLEAICLKCLEKDPDRRYSTARAFHEDLLAFVSNQPIRAARVGLLRRGWMWSKRNSGVALVLAFLFPLLLGIGWWTLSTNRKNKEMVGVLRRAADESQRSEERAELVEEMTLQELRARLEEASERLFGAPPEREDKMYQVLEGIALRWHEFAGVVGDDAKSAAIRAESHWRLGAIHNLLADHDQAGEYLEQACSEYQKLVDLGELGVELHLFYASALHESAKLSFYRGEAMVADGLFQRAMEQLTQVQDSLNSSPKFALQVSRIVSDYGVMLSRLHELGRSEQQLQRAIEVLLSAPQAEASSLEYRQQRCTCECSLASLLRQQGKLSAAVEKLEITRLDAERLVLEHPEDPTAWRGLSVVLQALGAMYTDMRRVEDAAIALSAALVQQQKLIDAFPMPPELRKDYAMTLNLLGVCRLQGSEFGEAMETIARSEQMFSELVASHPNRPIYTSLWITTLSNQLGVLTMQERLGEAIAIGRRLVSARQDLRNRFPESAEYGYGLAASENLFGQLLTRSGFHREAWEMLEGAERSFQGLVESNPGVLSHRSGLAKVYLSYAELEFAERQFERSAMSYGKVIYAIHHLPSTAVQSEFPLVPLSYLGQARCFHRLGNNEVASICLLQAFDSLGSQPSAATTKLRYEIEKLTKDVLPTINESRFVSELTARLPESRGPR